MYCNEAPNFVAFEKESLCTRKKLNTVNTPMYAITVSASVERIFMMPTDTSGQSSINRCFIEKIVTKTKIARAVIYLFASIRTKNSLNIDII